MWWEEGRWEQGTREEDEVGKGERTGVRRRPKKEVGVGGRGGGSMRGRGSGSSGEEDGGRSRRGGGIRERRRGGKRK